MVFYHANLIKNHFLSICFDLEFRICPVHFGNCIGDTVRSGQKYAEPSVTCNFRLAEYPELDTGLFKEEGAPDDDTPLYPKVLVRANINHKKIEKFTYDEALINEIRTQLFQFKMSGRLN